MLPYLSPAEERSCLDVGCGPGLVTRLLSRDFHHVLGVDCNREYFEQQQQGQEGGTSAPALHLRSSSAGASPDSDANIEVVAADFLDWELAQQFDVVVASHVLYQMPEDVLKVSGERAGCQVMCWRLCSSGLIITPEMIS